MPKYFPKVAKEFNIVKRDGNKLSIQAKVKFFGRSFPAVMETEVLQGKGFVSDN